LKYFKKLFFECLNTNLNWSDQKFSFYSLQAEFSFDKLNIENEVIIKYTRALVEATSQMDSGLSQQQIS